MIEKITEQPLWEYLKTANKPIVLYGMGNGADMIIDVLESMNIHFSDIFASDEFVRGQYFHEKKVLHLSEIEEKYSEFIILMTFALHSTNDLNRVLSLSEKYEFYSPTVPIVGKDLFTIDYIRENDALFDRAYNLLSDDKSRSDFISVLNFKISGKIKYLFECQSEKDELYRDIIRLGDSETIVDLGAYDGDTIREFLLAANGYYKKIYAFEPDSKNFMKLKRKTQELKNIKYFNIGAWDKRETLIFDKKAGRNSRQSTIGISQEFDSLDNLIDDDVTFIKMDIEGAELKALIGAEKLIKRCKPKLYVCGYHRNEDFFALPLKINEICSDYKIYFRHHPYIPAWESNFYAVKDGGL